MIYFVTLSPGPSWAAGKTIDEQDAETLGAHLATLRGEFDKGRVVFAGPFTEEDGGIILLAVDDGGAARAILDADPAIMAGLLTYAVKPVEAVFDAASGAAWSAPE